MANTEYDLIVLGSGPGGYVAAIRAAQLGLRTAVVEKDPKLGGTCLHRGCIPTKALLHTADMLEQMRHADAIGLTGEVGLDVAKAHAYKDDVVASNARGVEMLMKKNKIDVLHGFGRLLAADQVRVETDDGHRDLRCRHVLVATGSVPRELPPVPTDGERILNSDHMLKLERVPSSLVVIGAGAVGSELASIYRAFGSEVTLVEMLPRLLPLEDDDVSKQLAKSFEKRGIGVRTGTRLASVESTSTGQLRLMLETNGETSVLDAETLLIAIGRAPVSRGFGLEEAGVELDERGYVKVDGMMRTTAPGVYAIGDVVATPWLAHVASHEGILAAEHMAGRDVRPINYDHVPACTYCEPEVASVGLTEAQAKERGYDVATGSFPLTALGKARILRKTDGFVKIVRETKYDEVLGVHIIGAHATDLIAEACVALQIESTTEELMRTMHAHPTLSEAVMEAAHAALGHSIHI